VNLDGLLALSRRPVVRRLTGYSAGSVVAACTGELAFVMTYGVAGGGTTWASLAGFAGGAIPNYILNRRWAWSDRRGRSRRAEVVLYVSVAVASFAAAAVTTHWAEAGAVRLFPQRGWQTAVIAAAYLAVSGVFFLVKFALYERVVFAPRRAEPPAAAAATKAAGGLTSGQ
jgi:putative flippase GtrA